MAWKMIQPPFCSGLVVYQTTYPKGVHVAEAARRLSTKTTQRSDRWLPLDRPTAGFISRQSKPLGTETEALRDAEAMIVIDAGRLGCAPIDKFEKLQSIDITSRRPDCWAQSGGFTCSIEYEAVCRLKQLPLIDVCK